MSSRTASSTWMSRVGAASQMRWHFRCLLLTVDEVDDDDDDIDEDEQEASFLLLLEGR